MDWLKTTQSYPSRDGAGGEARHEKRTKTLAVPVVTVGDDR